jgi:hypothetical protein
MSKLFLIFTIFLVSGCGTFSIKNLEKSDASLEFAKQKFSKIDYAKLNEKLNLAKASIKSIGPVQLYSAQNVPFFIDQNAWNYVQRVKRSDGIDCYAHIYITLKLSNEFEMSRDAPGQFYCFESDDKYQSLEIVL